MKEYFKSGALALLAAALTVSVSSCHDDDPDYDNVTPPTVAQVHVISGSVASINGTGISGATVNMSGAATASVTTDSHGWLINGGNKGNIASMPGLVSSTLTFAGFGVSGCRIENRPVYVASPA